MCQICSQLRIRRLGNKLFNRFLISNYLSFPYISCLPETFSLALLQLASFALLAKYILLAIKLYALRFSFVSAMGHLIILLVVLLPCSIALYRWWHDPYRRMPEGARKLPGPWSTQHI